MKNETTNQEQKDLFEHLYLCSDNVQNLVSEWNSKEQDYKACEELKTSLEAIGYTCNYSLDSIPSDLQKITEDILFPRKCEVSGKVMSKGYLFEDCIPVSEEEAKGYVEKNGDNWQEELLKIDTEDEWFYYTEWEEIDTDEIAYNEDGKQFTFDGENWIAYFPSDLDNDLNETKPLKKGTDVLLSISFLYSIGDYGELINRKMVTVEDCEEQARLEIENHFDMDYSFNKPIINGKNIILCHKCHKETDTAEMQNFCTHCLTHL